MKPGIDYIGLGVGVVIVKNNKILLCNRKKSKSWSIPGGKVEFNERIEDAAKREIKEELGLKVDIKKFIAVAETFENNSHWISISFLGKITNGKPRLLATEEHSEIKWFNLNNLPKNQFLPSKVAIETYLKGDKNG